MVRKCAVSGCVNYSTHPKDTIHLFPKSNPFQRTRWIEFVRVASNLDVDNINLDNFGVCTRHFGIDAYYSEEDDNAKCRLKNNAVPTRLANDLDIYKWVSTDDGISIGDHTYAKRLSLERLQFLETEGLKWQIDQQQRELKSKDVIIKSIQNELYLMRRKLEDSEKQCREKHHFNARILGCLDKMFSKNQIRLIQNPNLSHVHWSEEDKTKAIALHSVSPRAYLYLRDSLHFPLPAQSSIHKWLQNIEISPGKVIPAVKNILKAQLQNETPMNLQCVLAIDEMKIDKRYCYYAQEDRILGKEENVTAITVRGLFDNWKQLLYFSFQSCINAEELHLIIRELYEVRAEVVALTSDMGSKNQRLWKQLDVCKVKNGVLSEVSFKHPNTSKNVWIFPDLPHLVKLLRNHALDSSITLTNETIISKKMFQELIRIQKDELKLTPNITHRHIEVKGRQRQAVRPAFELFSHRLSEMIRFLFPRNQVRLKQAEFLQLVNDFCDLSNIRTREKTNKFSTCAYGMYPDEQEALYDSAYDMFSSMKVGKRKNNSYAPFQKGLLVFITSMKGLLKDMKQSPVNCEYIMTSRLNQDLLENTFSRIRGFGHFNENPNAVEVIYRIKKLLLSWNFLKPKSPAVEIENEENIQSVKLIKILNQSRLQNNPTQPFSETLSHALTLIDPTVIPETLEDFNYGIEGKCEQGGIEYVAGYIAKKLIESHPCLSKKGAGDLRDAFWVGKLSEGLTEPSDYWYSLFKKLEEYFIAVHPYGRANQAANICQNLKESIMTAFPEVHEKIIQFYVRIRTFVRIKYLNKKLEDEAFRYRGQGLVYSDEEDTNEVLTEEGMTLAQDLNVFL